MPHLHQSPRSVFTNKKFAPEENLKARIQRTETKVDWSPEVKKSILTDPYVANRDTVAAYRFKLPQELKRIFQTLTAAIKSFYHDYQAAKRGTLG